MTLAPLLCMLQTSGGFRQPGRKPARGPSTKQSVKEDGTGDYKDQTSVAFYYRCPLLDRSDRNHNHKFLKPDFEA